MSSRRKSRPVRRLDMITNPLPNGEFPAPFLPLNGLPEGDSPAEADGNHDDASGATSPEMAELNEEHNAEPSYSNEAKMNASVKSRPPEGVYILQPEGVSDDEDSKTPKNSTSSSVPGEVRKRSHEENSSKMQNQNEGPGLDLSVKRPRMEEDKTSYLDYMKSSSAPNSKSTSPNLFLDETEGTSSEMNEDMEKYNQLMQLIAQQRPLPQAMEEVGLSPQKFFELHRISNQMGTGSQNKDLYGDSEKISSAPVASSAFDKLSSNDQASNAMSNEEEWTNEKESHDAKIQALLREANEDVIQQQRQNSEMGKSSLPSQLPMGLHPSMAATLMASLSNNPDPNREERQEFLKNLFMKAQGYYSGQSKTPTKNSDSYISLTKTPSSLDRSKNDSITTGTVSSGVGSIKKGTLDPANFQEEVFDQYIAKFTNMNRCGSLTCPYFTRDHYHCVVEDCNYQRFTNKADVIRHYNMHKKRDNSLAHGFLRFSPTEDCSSKYPNCHLNGKSTHYHCMQPECNKVYTSTSDVMTHENFHKKYMQFVCSGFKRFRATERCDLDSCSFRDQKTTHFHCTREDCNFTFKNKCDIEKHKTYHLRDDAYTSKGFKKYYKNESCSNEQCVWNYTANHFHCLRQGCNFSFTSTSQMESHKRKHDRNEFMGEVPDSSRDIPSTGSPSMLSPALFKEAARKLLSTMPTASLPQGLSPSTMNHQLLYKAITSQNDSNLSIKTESPASPAISSIRSLAPLNLGSSPQLASSTKVTVKEEPSWKAPPAYLDNQSAVNLSTSSSMPNDCDVSVSKSRNIFSETSRSDWPRSSGVISPSMAICAAAALKPASSQQDSAAGQNMMLVKEEQEQENAVAILSGMEGALKYFARMEPFKCLLLPCDFNAKHHFHCLVEDCGAVFTVAEKIVKHAKFHQTIESMGAALPIRDLGEIKHQKYEEQNDPPKNDLSAPPPGFIALQSKAPKPTDLSKYEKLPNSNSTSPTLPLENEPSSVSTALVPLNGIPLQASQIAQLYASASAMLKGTPSSPQIKVPFSQPMLSSTPASSAYRFLQSQAALLNLSQPPPLISTNLATSSENTQPGFGNSEKKDIGFVHFKAGMPCLREDCKYIQQNHWHCTMNRCRYVCKSLGKAQTHRQAHDSLEAYAKAAKQCFRSFSVKKKCPNANCEFKLRGHYHCLKPGCQFATIGTSKLPWHMKKHEKIARREASGFKYFTKKEQCGHFGCKYNGLFSHYHCIRTGCTFAFQYKHQMSTHVRKHLRRMLGRSYAGDVQDIDHTNVDSGDDSLPLIIDEVEEAEQRPGMVQDDQGFEQDQQTLSQQQMEMLERMTKQVKSAYASMASRDMSDSVASEQDMSLGMSGIDDSNSEENMSSDDCGALDLSSVAAGSSKSNESVGQQQQNDVESMNEDSMSNGDGQMMSDGNMDLDNDDGQRSSHSPNTPSASGMNFQMNNVLLDGFQRFDTNDNCAEQGCPYVFKVSHYHCTRENCQYRFTGRTHMFKHQQHHDRVAGLIRDDFKRFRAVNPCEDEHCEYRGKNTHFHCLRCDFKCIDSAKVGTHRRKHMKADTLEQSGFQRIRGKDDCGRDDCKYRYRNMSHFHCLQPGCLYTVVGLTGIELHAEKHRRGLLQTTTPSENANLILKNLQMFHTMQQRMMNASMGERVSPVGISPESGPHNLSMPTMPTLRQFSSAPQTPTSPQSDNGNSPLFKTPNDSTQLLSKFAFISSSTPGQEVNVGSPVASNSAAMVTESVGS